MPVDLQLYMQMWQVEAISNLHATLNIKTTAKAGLELNFWT